MNDKLVTGMTIKSHTKSTILDHALQGKNVGNPVRMVPDRAISCEVPHKVGTSDTSVTVDVHKTICDTDIFQ